MSDLPQLRGGPADGMVLPSRYADAPKIQIPVRDEKWNFATYLRDPAHPHRFFFGGFCP